jgi:hypothetical protein
VEHAGKDADRLALGYLWVAVDGKVLELRDAYAGSRHGELRGRERVRLGRL